MEVTVALVVLVALAIASVPAGRKAWRTERVAPWEVGLLYGPRGFVRELAPGLHRRFDPFDRQYVVTVATVTQALAGQTVDVISQDQFAFRLTLAPVVTVTDARALVEQSVGARQIPGAPGMGPIASEPRYDRLQPTLAAAALAAVASRTLDAVLADPQAVVVEIAPSLAPALPGTRLDRLLLTGVTLPPEVRKMFTEVERARREGLASLERARSEQAALRALANAARNFADNPALAQLRTLQMMENAKGAKTFILGGRPEDAA